MGGGGEREGGGKEEGRGGRGRDNKGKENEKRRKGATKLYYKYLILKEDATMLGEGGCLPWARGYCCLGLGWTELSVKLRAFVYGRKYLTNELRPQPYTSAN